ncbi:MAG: glycoside hydrolase family 3 N-terminal domain-containing protein [Acidithiobacillales bacterium]
MAGEASQRFVFGLEGPELLQEECSFFRANPPLGFLLFRRNLLSAPQAAALIAELRGLSSPPPLLFVDQEGGAVDRLGPLLGLSFPSATAAAAAGTDRVHEGAFLMGRAARLLGFDVDFAPVLDLAQPGTGAVVLEGRCFGFHPEDVTLSGTVFLHGLARAGVATCLKHFPGLGRGAVDSHLSLPVVEAHDVDLMVTDVHPFSRLSRNSDGVMVGHAAYPGLTRSRDPASLSPFVYDLLRKRLGFTGVVYTDDLTMGALGGSLAERSSRAARAGADVLVVAKGIDEYEECVARLGEAGGPNEAVTGRLDVLRTRCRYAPRPPLTSAAWARLADEAKAFLELLEEPREKRP